MKVKAKVVEDLVQKKEILEKKMCECKEQMGNILNYAIMKGNNKMTEEISNIYQMSSWPTILFQTLIINHTNINYRKNNHPFSPFTKSTISPQRQYLQWDIIQPIFAPRKIILPA